MNGINSAVLLIVLLFSQANAQDIIQLKPNGTGKGLRLEVRVVDVTMDEVLFQKWKDRESEVMKIPKEKVSCIAYNSGRVEAFTQLDSVGIPEKVSIEAFPCERLAECDYRGGRLFYEGEMLREDLFDYALSNCTSSYDSYRKGGWKVTTGKVFTFVGGGLLTFGALLEAIEIVLGPDEEDIEEETVYMKEYRYVTNTFLGVGALSVSAGVPLWIVGHRQQKPSLDEIREKCSKKTSYQEPVHLDLVSKNRGVGLSLKF